jgi:NAD(P)-dependent dehydrogenase (short-subunit alcohol dehydrogenase family)
LFYFCRCPTGADVTQPRSFLLLSSQLQTLSFHLTARSYSYLSILLLQVWYILTPWAAYGQAKTANIYFANEIERRFGEKGLHALSLHPGGIATGLQVHLDASFHEMMRSNPAVVKGMMNTEQGAATTIYAAVSKEWEGRGGKYLSKCIEQKPVESKPAVLGDDGYSAWAYDAEKEGRLWKESLKMVRMDDDSTAL